MREREREKRRLNPKDKFTLIMHRVVVIVASCYCTVQSSVASTGAYLCTGTSYISSNRGVVNLETDSATTVLRQA